MTKKELKTYLLHYNKIKGDLLKLKDKTIINNKTFILYPWVYKLPNIINQIIDSENSIITKNLINESIILGKLDKYIQLNLAISESTYYRLKHKIIEKIFNIYIFYQDVSLQEILNDYFRFINYSYYFYKKIC